MNKIAITGLSGVIGRIIEKTASRKYKIIDLFHTSPYLNSDNHKNMGHHHIDILSEDDVKRTLDLVTPDVIIHMAAFTHIDICEKDKIHGTDGIVWKTNVEGTKHITSYCVKNFIPLVQLSTECVFDGKKTSYDENDKKNPKNWYGKTKHEAEEIVLSSGAKSSIIRSVIAYHDNDCGKTIFGKFASLFQEGKDFTAVSDQQMTPTYTYDIAKAVWEIVKKDIHGIFHVTPDVSLTPYEFAVLMAKQFHLDASKIKKATLVSFFGKERASLRLHQSCLSQKYSNKILEINPRDPSDAFASMVI